MKKIILFGLSLYLLTSCGRGSNVDVDKTPIPAATETPADTINDGDMLSICILGEPNSLYMYDPLSVAARKTLSILYDGILPAPNKLFKPSVLVDLPTYENGLTLTAPVTVKQDEMVMTADLRVKPLRPGDLILPTGCGDVNCAVVFDGEPIAMDQVMITLEFIEGFHWSDGETLTVDDSLFSYGLAKKSLSTSVLDAVDRTRSYEKTSDTTIQWWGIPGYLWVEPSAVLFPPLPEHLMAGKELSEFEKNAMGDQYLVGWGAYKFDSWEDGDMLLAPNEHYYDPDQQVPEFKQLTLRYFTDTTEIFDAFSNGLCDIVDDSAGFDPFIPVLSEMNKNAEVNLRIEPSPMIEKLVFNTHEDHIGGTKDINPLSDPMTRAGLSACVDRYALINYDLQGFPLIADSLIYPIDFALPDEIRRFEFSMPEAKEYLERSGWTDDDHDPRTTRVSKDIEGLADGTEMKLIYATTDSSLRTGMANVIARMFKDCGIDVEVKTYSIERFFEPSSNGILSSGNFDIAEFATGSYETPPRCVEFTSDQIPSAENGWKGVNYGGYSNLDLETLCLDANYVRKSASALARTLAAAHDITVFDSVSVPLFHQFNVTIAKPDICLPKPELLDLNGTFNIVQITRGPTCFSLTR